MLKKGRLGEAATAFADSISEAPRLKFHLEGGGDGTDLGPDNVAVCGLRLVEVAQDPDVPRLFDHKLHNGTGFIPIFLFCGKESLVHKIAYLYNRIVADILRAFLQLLPSGVLLEWSDHLINTADSKWLALMP